MIKNVLYNPNFLEKSINKTNKFINIPPKFSFYHTIKGNNCQFNYLVKDPAKKA